MRLYNFASMDVHSQINGTRTAVTTLTNVPRSRIHKFSLSKKRTFNNDAIETKKNE